MAEMLKFSSRRLQIGKANATIVIIIAVASFVTIFSLVACKSLLSQRSYQAKVIGAKEKAKKQLKANLQAADQLVNAYQAFVTTPQNVLGGDPKGLGDRDGDNARIVLDALPSKYDFPALASSIEKMLSGRNFNIDVISGTDDELNQQNQSSPSPTTIEIPVQISVTGSYDSVKDLLSVLERSIRPFNVQRIVLSGSNSSMQVDLSLKTYFQPEKKLTITKEKIK